MRLVLNAFGPGVHVVALLRRYPDILKMPGILKRSGLLERGGLKTVRMKRTGHEAFPAETWAEGIELAAKLPYRAVSWALVAGVATTLATSLVTGAAAEIRFTSKERAFVQGYSAFKGRQYEIAVPALRFAAEHNVMRAKYYLARIYSDNSGGFTDHALAYRLLQQIISGSARVDPKDYRIAPYVARSLISIARYERDGIRALNLKPNTHRAIAYFDQAATFYNDDDAQFELAKHYLSGDGVEPRVPDALNWLARLSKRGHAGAQAYLANLYWDGRHVARDQVRSLALITVAVENAHEEDRFWIEDVHQNIFCEAGQRTRTRVYGVVDGWRRKFARAREISASVEDQLGPLGLETRRICANGDLVGDLMGRSSGLAATGAVTEETLRQPTTAAAGVALIKPSEEGPPPARSSASSLRPLNGFGLQEAGDTRSAPVIPERPERTIRSATSDDNAGVQADDRRKQLNGFTLQGQSGFGFSLVPGNR